MVSVRIYVEGGGDGKLLRSKCRKGFSEFFQQANFAGRMPRIVACGRRNKAYEDFCYAFSQSNPTDFIILLVDSEGPVSKTPWEHLKSTDGWIEPARASDDNAHLMVQCMEAWFLAEKKVLQDYYGQHFSEVSLPANPNIEQIPKDDILKGLSNATRNTTKGEYDKGDHSFAILARISPSLVKDAAPHCKRLIILLDSILPR
jgi:hypothetical protein